jgi:hypothetical protein
MMRQECHEPGVSSYPIVFCRPRAIWVATLLLAGRWAMGEFVQSPQRVRVVTVEAGGGPGEISQFTAEGQLLARWEGFSNIQSVQTAGRSRLMVLDRGGGRFIEFDRSGGVQRSGSFRRANAFQAVVLPSGHFLLAAGKEGVVEIDESGEVVWRALAPEPAAEVVSAVRLADNTTLCVTRFTAVPLYQIPPGSTQWKPVLIPGIGQFKDPWLAPKLRVLDSPARQVALWYELWPNWYKLAWDKGVLLRWAVYPAKAAVRVIAGGPGGATWVTETPFEVIRVSPSGKETGRLAIADEIRDIAGADDGSVYVAVERVPDAVREAHRSPSPAHKPFSWIGLGLWVLGSLFFVGFLQLTAWRKASDIGPRGSGPEEPSGRPVQERQRWPRERWGVVATAAAIGLALASVGCMRLFRQEPRQAIPLLLLGAVLTATAGQWWSRVICGRVDLWWLNVRTARFPRWLVLPTWCTVAALMVGGLVLWRWRTRGAHPNGSIALWVSLQILCFGLAALSPCRRRFDKSRIPWETVIHVGGLLLLGWIALTTDLEGVPRNVHNDVGSVVQSALDLLEGRADPFFSGGYAEIPYPGHLPASLGLLIAGKTVAGSRLGGCLVGLAAILGTYALGCEYRSTRLGLFASLLLIASIPFLHFSRSTPFGEVTAYSVWLVFLLLRAVRTARPGVWLVLGVVGGWGLFLFYSARVALLGIVLAGVFLSLRSYQVTLRRWYGPLLFTLGFAITVLPMVPYWLSNPGAFSHRMDTSFSLYDPHSGFHSEVLTRAFGEPFLRTLGMFYTERDKSGQGTMSPAGGPIEATLLSIGLVAVLADGWGANVACLVWFVTMLLGCGVFAQATPWYTRLVPVTPIVSLFMARAIDLLIGFVPLRRPAFKRIVTAVAAVVLISLAAKNLKTYLQYERARPITEFSAFGRAALALGPKYEFYCVTFQRLEFTCLNGSFAPYFATLDVRDLRDPARAMPFRAGRSVAIMVPFQRTVPRPLDPRALVQEIVARYPRAKVRYVYGEEGGFQPRLGAIVVLHPGPADPGSASPGLR